MTKAAAPFAGTAHRRTSCNQTTAEQRAEIDEILSDAERGEAIPADGVLDDLAERFGVADGYDGGLLERVR